MEHNAGVQTTNMGEVRLECLNVHALVLVFLKKRCLIFFSLNFIVSQSPCCSCNDSELSKIPTSKTKEARLQVPSRYSK